MKEYHPMKDLIRIGRFRFSLWGYPVAYGCIFNSSTYVWSVAFWRFEACYLTKKFAEACQ